VGLDVLGNKKTTACWESDHDSSVIHPVL